MQISFFYRKKRNGAFSIEELFHSIEHEIKKQGLDTIRLELPRSGAKPNDFLKNLFFVNKHKSKINHVTGETQYIALVLGSKSVMTVHDIGSVLCGNPLKNLIVKMLWFWLPSLLVKNITVISNFSKNELLKIIPWAKNKIHVIHNPINGHILKNADFQVKSPQPPGNIFKVLHIGTKHNKNLLNTIEALQGISCELTIIGPLTKTLKNKLKECRITYTNMSNVSFQEIINNYKKVDIVCFASTYEGFGMPIIEAQVLGKPIVTSNVAAMPEIAGKSAVLVDPYSVNSIREGILSLMNDENYRTQKIKEGYKNIERFRIERICEKYIELYKNIGN